MNLCSSFLFAFLRHRFVNSFLLLKKYVTIINDLEGAFVKELDHQYTYIVGVSGGCDSMYLLDHLYSKHYSIVVCHVDYGIRNDTIEDYRIVKEYTDSHHIPFYFKKVEHYEQGNFQEQARNIRYDFFSETGKKFGTNKVVVAHHKDDIYETILLQQLRDTKRLYLGLKEVSQVRDCEVYRIMLDTTKKEILEYCQGNNLKYHDDYTNFETHYKRDYIRNVVLPKMSEDQKKDLLEKANKHNARIEARKNYIHSLLTDPLDYTLIKEEDLEDVLYYMTIPYVSRISQGLLEEMKKCLKNDGNSQIDLPVNFVFTKEYHNISIQKKDTTEAYHYIIEKLEEIDTPYFKIRKEGHIYDGIGVKESDFPLCIRTLQQGDRIETKVGYKKVSRVFIDKKIPAHLRKSWPIVVNKDGEIILIPHIMKKLSYFNVKANLFVIQY